MVISPVKSDCLKVSAQKRPAGPPPMITYLFLLLGSLFAKTAVYFLGSVDGTWTKNFPSLSIISNLGSPSIPGAPSRAPVTTEKAAACHGQTTLSSNKYPVFKGAPKWVQ